MERKLHWYVFKASKPTPRLRLTFSPRSPGNKWLLREQLIEDLPIIKLRNLDEVSIKDTRIIVKKTSELISEVLKVLYENEYQTLSYLINKKIKIIIHLERAGFTQNQHFQLAKIIEDNDLQDLIIPRMKIT